MIALHSYKTQFIASLQPLVGEPEAQSFFYLVLEQLHQLERIDLALAPAFTITEEQWQQWENIRGRLLSQEPIQYILGKAHFYGLTFAVNPAVLIPRPETEELVAWVLGSLAFNPQSTTHNPKQVLDIGTGSGCIAISLAKNLPDVQVSALDVSEKALETARANAKLHEVEINFSCQNILEMTSLTPFFDVIVSNPPYVRNLEKQEIKPNVLEHEPHLALFVSDDDPLLFYRKIGELARQALTPTGKLFVEINQYLGQETLHLFAALGFSKVELKKDMYGNDRLICVQR